MWRDDEKAVGTVFFTQRPAKSEEGARSVSGVGLGMLAVQLVAGVGEGAGGADGANDFEGFAAFGHV